MNNKKLVRGLRNNNPFNIKKSSLTWIGKLKNGSDPTFEQFQSMRLGLRAGMKLLINYVVNGYDTPEKIIKRFAPITENNTANYLDYIVHNRANLRFIKPDEHVSSVTALCMLASRMIQYECCLSNSEVYALALSSGDLCGVIKEYNLLENHKILFV